MYWAKVLMLWMFATPLAMLLVGGAVGGIGASGLYLFYYEEPPPLTDTDLYVLDELDEIGRINLRNARATEIVAVISVVIGALPIGVMLSFTWFWLGGKEKPATPND